jgi:hypothetical protein
MSGGERHQVVVHVSGETLTAGGGDRCEIEDGPAIAAETARRLTCDASVVAIVENEKGEPLSVGRRTRTIPPAIQRALNSRFDSVRPIGDWRQLPAVHERAGVHINARTAATRWDGGRIDYGIATDVLMSLPRDVSAEAAPSERAQYSETKCGDMTRVDQRAVFDFVWEQAV